MAIFVTFEGIDGSGKTTQARRLVARLEDEGFHPLFVREPGGTSLSESVREILLDPDRKIVPFAELMLFSAARAQLVEERIRPALERGTPVVCDRFYDSTTAYQGGGRRVAEVDWLRDLHRWVTGGLTPDRTYLIDVSPEEALRRRDADRADAGGDADRMESSGERFYGRVAETYRSLAAEEPDRIVRCDGEAPPEEVHRVVWDDAQKTLLGSDGTHREHGGSSEGRRC